MEPQIRHYTKADFIETKTGNKVSRQSVLCGSQNIRMQGNSIIMPGVVVRGDLAAIAIGRFTTVGKNSVLRPSYKRFKGDIAYFPTQIGSYVTIGDSCVVAAATIGSHVAIGANSIVSRGCVLMDCCCVEPGTVLPPNSVVPPYSIAFGHPVRIGGELSEGFQEEQEMLAMDAYSSFRAGP
eukprot:CAMPEP_0177666016 /NCGR_PEP_ID=MMETSP0447-20121125/21361_1 /TAXON_ID=0 /ORGANISM="Stygamoeba regulata, Strain BSH-02190019" /LENGTH=180 /DNA_ID=CAMNT_0019172145 /DNA_START=34 /DNA_END=576 /DNA_ORIENTATION=+